MRKLMVALVVVLSVLMTSCSVARVDDEPLEGGQLTPPSVAEIQANVQFFELTRPDGSTMPCFLYADSGNGYYTSYSWFDVDCDWDR